MNLPDSLLQAARERAKQEGRTVTSLVEEALWDLLAKERASSGPRPLPTDGHPRGRFLVDIDDKDALWEILDADEPR